MLSAPSCVPEASLFGGRRVVANGHTKSERIAQTRAALAAAPLGAVEAGSELHEWLVRLVEAHPRAEEKCAGLVGFIIAEGRTGRETVAVYLGGREEPFSWLKCCGAGGFKADVRNAYREAVEEQVAPLRRRGLHVDHAPPWTFAAIVKAFELEHGSPTDADIDRHGLVRGVRFTPARRGLFAEYHRARAVLRHLTPQENLSRRAS